MRIYLIFTWLLLAFCTVALAQSPSTSANSPYAKALVDQHNVHRKEVGVAPLVWSETLAKSAAAWANTLKQQGCAFEHSSSNYGENIFMGTVGFYTALDAVESWASEKVNYHIADNSCDPRKMCGHYTQIVWANTTEVGCAEVACDGNLIVVCQYNPAGNYVGEKPYGN